MHIRLGHALIKTSSWDRAVEAFTAALRQDPDQVDAYVGIALVRQATRDWEAMLAAALEATERIFHNPRGHTLVGRALLGLERYDEAEQARELALHQAPRNRDALRSLARLYRDLRPDQFKLNSLKLRLHVAREQAKAGQRRQEARPAPARPTRARGGWSDPADVVTVVSGLPRSGTSMMMQMLTAGGVVPYTDKRRQADSDNPRGYFEHEMATRLASNAQWIPEVRGKAVKIAAPLLPRLPGADRYAIVMMRRDLQEVAASQREMLKRLGRPGAALSGDELISALGKQMDSVDRWVEQSENVRAIDIAYDDALADAAGTAQRIAEFLGRPLDVAAMAGAVDPALRRQNAANPGVPA